jgi:hypothetical protein
MPAGVIDSPFVHLRGTRLRKIVSFPKLAQENSARENFARENLRKKTCPKKLAHRNLAGDAAPANTRA